ncbi:ribosomal-processing cysteine protease Prp [Paenalkalicoccus suaedae]|uniref:Ribosomal processing cysteine protease Prp n=1 Tax=Paenalkalicoccus suaedae TaxID=2592382 RepID=A0A859FGP6_9BACI|nr:ribosomal-processing cysteine protease Prp [Paenalkalicoccus suaedae]QKS71834.1 ribosomal-processing cysteine protease Prp [Paenalkalicoccus suaedae]
MIRISFNRNDRGLIDSFTMSGHAESGPYGQDLVCAGASAVSFGSVNAIAVLCDTELEVDMEGDGGYLSCRIPDGLDPNTYEKIQLILDAMLVSFQTMEAQYAEFIKITSP